MSIPIAEKYIQNYESLGFGMFIHWGLYSQKGKGEWTYALDETRTDADKKNYFNLINTFTAEDFDAEKLVLIAKNAGCRYITLTTRHHEGFSLYDTCGLNEFDAMHSKAGRDIVREFVDACNKYGIMPFFYHTTLDWWNSDYKEDFSKYLEYLRKSVEILCKNYGKIGGLWFDGNWDKPNEDWREDELYQIIRKYQPDAIIINNTGLHERGKVGNKEIDAVTFEQGTPTPMDREGMEKYLAAEMCLTVNEHWGIGTDDINYKSPKELIESLCDCRKVGANCLINIGPEAQGGLDSFQEGLFKLMGKWMVFFGEAIYNGRPYAFYPNERNFVLKSKCGKYLYFFAYNLGRRGSNNVVLGGKHLGNYLFNDVYDKIKSIEWMDSGEKLNFVQDENSVCVNLTGYEYGKALCVRVAKALIL